MPIINRVTEFEADIAGWRRDFHTHPELQYDVHRTAGRVAELLKSFGVDEVVTGLGRTGVVALIKGRSAGRTIALRADMDALPITEKTGKPYASQVSGKMHACGHDGHTAMLLGAARYLAETRNFGGTAILIFQPAEEGGAGAKAMLDDGLVARFGIEEFYGLHNMPGLPAGHFGVRAGGIMAASDRFEIIVSASGGHAAMPHKNTDAVLAAAQVVVALQSIVSRNVDPMRQAVISVTMIEGGTAFNIMPGSVRLVGTARSLDEAVRDLVEAKIASVAESIAGAFGAKASVTYSRGYPVTVNAAQQSGLAADVARTVSGVERVDGNIDATMGGEDFAYMLQARPGAYILLGNGPTSELHSDTYDFNDAIIPAGVSYWARLVETALPAA